MSLQVRPLCADGPSTARASAKTHGAGPGRGRTSRTISNAFWTRLGSLVVRSGHRWPSEAGGPNLEQLVAREAELEGSLEGVALGDEVERLADRHSAMERRVAALEAQHDPTHGLITLLEPIEA